MNLNLKKKNLVATLRHLVDNGFRIKIQHKRHYVSGILHDQIFLGKYQDAFGILPVKATQGVVVTKPISVSEAIEQELGEKYPRGGLTFVSLYKGEYLVGECESVCDLSDNYCKRRGVEIALGRILKKTGS